MAAPRMPVLLVLALLVPACSESLEILGPTPAGEGITIYLHADYAGPSQAVNHDVSDLEKVEGPCTHGAEGEKPTWTDCLSSLRVEPGWAVTLYRDDDFKGRSVTLTADTPNLRELPGPCDGSFNDCVSSIRVMKQ
jgi:peptidase inhibitor family I36